MKKVLLFLIALVVIGGFSTLQAKVVDHDEALAVATDFLRTHNATALATGEVREVWNANQLSVAAVTTLSATQAPTFYVFAPEGSKGFVVVSADDYTLPVLGYSFDQDFAWNGELPCNVRWWCEAMDNEITQLRQSGRVSARKASQGIATLADDELLLETALWNQSAPYYNDCPTYNGSRCLTGCGPTATAEAMRYHKYPATGTGTTDAYNTSSHNIYVDSRDLSSHTYDWDNMLLDYSNGYTDEEASAVALLMADLGAMYEADYGTDGTGIYVGPDQVAKLYANYGYSGSMVYKYAGAYDDDEWTALMKEQISTYGPVPYTGDSDSSGHMFLIDGYQSNSYFHINWGWGGYDNGYFLLPSMEYHNDQAGIFNFTPDDGSTPKCTIEVYGDGLSANTSTFETGVEFTMSVTGMYNNSLITYYGEYAFVLVDKDDNIKEILAKTSYESGLWPNYYLRLTNYPCTITTELESTDCLRAAYKEDGDTEWHLADPHSEGTVYKIHVVEQDYTVSMASPGLSVDATEFYEEMSFIANASMQNDSEGTIDRCYFHFVLTDGEGNVKETISSNFSFSNFAAGQARATSDVECTMPSEFTAGDRIRLLYQTNTLNEEGWKLVTTNAEDIPWELEITEAMIVERDYPITMYTPGLSVDTDVFAQNAPFTASGYPLNNTGYTIEKPYFAFALTDSEGKVKELISKTYTSTNSLNTNTYLVMKDIDCTITVEIEIGDWVCMVYQNNHTDADGWKVVEPYTSNVPWRIVITEDNLGEPLEHEFTLYQYNNGLTVSADKFYTGVAFTATSQPANLSGETVDTYLRYALTDSEGEVKEWISDYVSFSLPSGYYDTYSDTPCTITGPITAGDRIRLFYEGISEREDTWKVMEPYNSNVPWEVEITEDMLVGSLMMYSPGLSVNANEFYSGVEFTAGVCVFNPSGETLSTNLCLGLTDSEGNFKEWISTNMTSNIEAGGYQTYSDIACAIASKIDPNDHIRLFYQQTSDDDDSWTVIDAYIGEACPIEFVITWKMITDYENDSQLRYNVLSENTVEVTSGNGNPAYHGYLVIPESVMLDGVEYTVVGISYRAFADCSELNYVEMPNTITYIGEQAFNNCSSLSEVNFPENLTEIGDWSYTNCSALAGELIVPDKVVTIGGSAFLGCSALTSIVVGNGVTTISASAFQGCDGVKVISLGENLETIGNTAFSGTHPEGELVIPNKVTSLGSWAFSGCSGLTSLTLGSSVETIGGNAFASCYNITSITTLNPVPPTLSDGAFSNYNATLYVPAGTIDEYERVWSSQAFSDYNELDYAVLKIGATGYSTYYNEDYDIDLTDTGITAYWAEGIEGSTVTLTDIGATIPAKTAVVFKGTQTYFTASDATASSAESEYSSNMLHGHSTTGMLKEENGDYVYYMLTTGGTNGEVGFYYGTSDGGAFESAANKAWLAVPESMATSLSIKFKDNDTTGISSVSANYGEGDGNIYTIQGIRVNDMSQKGVYIVNGRKVLVR